MSAHERTQGIADAAQAREELYSTLSQLTERLNYAKRVDEAIDRAKHAAAKKKREQPAVFVAGVVGVTALAAAITWGVTSAVISRFK